MRLNFYKEENAKLQDLLS